jgi:hypothetical protein
MTINAWANSADVSEITQVEVDDAMILAAQGIVESVCHRTYKQVLFKKTDIGWLRKAVAYQAAWMSFQPDLFFRTGTTNTSGDGISMTVATKADNYLAPLAGRAIKNLSWMRSRSVRVRTPFLDGSSSTTPLDPSLADDSNLPWDPM